MTDPSAPPLDAAAVLRLLDRHGVRCVVVRGLAAAAHGATRVTFDIDVVPQWTIENLDRLASALREAGAVLHRRGDAAPISFPIDAAALRQFEVSTWRTRLGDIDVIVGTPTGERGALARFESLAARAESRTAFGVTILVASLDDVIESKQALAREPDLVALPELHRLRGQRQRRSEDDEG